MNLTLSRIQENNEAIARGRQGIVIEPDPFVRSLHRVQMLETSYQSTLLLAAQSPAMYSKKNTAEQDPHPGPLQVSSYNASLVDARVPDKKCDCGTTQAEYLEVASISKPYTDSKEVVCHKSTEVLPSHDFSSWNPSRSCQLQRSELLNPGQKSAEGDKRERGGGLALHRR